MSVVPLATFSVETEKKPQKTIYKDSLVDRKLSERRLDALVYGPGLGIMFKKEEEILSKYRRLPSLWSAQLALETVFGMDDDIDVCELLDTSRAERNTAQLDVHHVMESRLEL